MRRFTIPKNQSEEPVSSVGKEDLLITQSGQELTINSISENLHLRYMHDLIYTNVGRMLVAVNPYKELPIFSLEIVQRYYHAGRSTKMPPHIFGIAQLAFDNLKREKLSQALIISGESGAGKTESMKLILRYLASITTKHNQIEQRLLEANPIIEAFGNAKTIRNNNSSRFGKFVQIYFGSGSDGTIIGAKVVQYLLEKSRICKQAINERNFHIFYQICSGLSENEKKEYQINRAEEFHYLTQSKCLAIEGINDSDDFYELKNALSCFAFSSLLQKEMFDILVAILHLGNLKFETKEDSLIISDQKRFELIAKLMGVEPQLLSNALTQKTMQIQGQASISIKLESNQAMDGKDSLATTIYSSLFEWLIDSINNSLSEGFSETFIGILDIFGFENFKINNFEQLCINYANEMRQQLFIQEVFKLEQEEYKKENINWNSIEFIDNQPCLDLIQKYPLGIFPILDEECRFPKATDETFLKKLHSNLENNPYYTKPRVSTNSFVIHHYAGKVVYEVTGFLEKNKNTIQQDLIELCNRSKNKILSSFFVQKPSSSMNLKKPVGFNTLKRGTKLDTIASQFKKQLEDLKLILEGISPNFVMCIKPNHTQKPNNFDSELVKEQLSYTGMLETVKIRQRGYAIWFPFSDFYIRYRPIHPLIMEKNKDIGCNRLLQELKLKSSDYQKGKTKIFLKENLYQELEIQREKSLEKSVIPIQKTWRMWANRKYYLNLKQKTIKSQSIVRMWIARRLYQKYYDATVIIQSFYKMIKAKEYVNTLKSALLLQSLCRGFLVRKDYDLQRKEIQRLKEEQRIKEEKERELKLKKEEQDRLQKIKEEQEKLQKIREEKEREEKERLQKITEEKEKQLKLEEEKEKQLRLDQERRMEALKLEEIKLIEERKKIEEAKKELEKLKKELETKHEDHYSGMIPFTTSPHSSAIEHVQDDIPSSASSFVSVTSEKDNENFVPLSVKSPPRARVRSIRVSPKNQSPKLLPLVLKNSGNNTDSKEFFKKDSPSSSRKSTGNESLDSSEESKDLFKKAKPSPKASTVRAVRMSKMQGQFTVGKHSTVRPGTVTPGTLNLKVGETLRGTKSTGNINFGTHRVSSSNIDVDKTVSLLSPVFHSYRQGSAGQPTSNQVMEDPPPIITLEESRDFPFSTFAKKNIQSQIQGKFRKRKVTASEKMLSTPKRMDQPLLKLSAEDTEKALELWDNILVYSGIISSKALQVDLTTVAQNVLAIGISFPQLRNELYCQLAKQLTSSENLPEGCNEKNWELLSLCCSCFPPNHYMLKYFASFLIQHPDKDKADLCLKQLNRTVHYGPRNVVPTAKEILAFKSNRPFSIKVNFMDGYQLNLNIDLTTVAGEVFEKTYKAVGLQSGHGFALYEISNELERSLSWEEKIGDIISKWEQYNQIMSMRGVPAEYSFFFKKQLYLNVLKDPDDIVEYDLFFHQSISNVLRGTWVCSEATAITLGSIQFQSRYKTNQDTSIIYKMMDQYIPRKLLDNHTVEEWSQMIQNERGKLKGVHEDKLPKMYMEIVKGTPLFGWTVFAVQHRSLWKIPPAFDLGISVYGIKFMKSDSKETLRSYNFDDLLHWSYTQTTFKLEVKAATIGEDEIILQTIQGIEIATLIHNYIKELSKNSQWARALQDCKESKSDTGENLLKVSKGEIIHIEKRIDDRWVLGNINNVSGLCPIQAIQFLTQPPKDKNQEVASRRPTLLQITQEEKRRRTSTTLLLETGDYQFKSLWKESFRVEKKKSRQALTQSADNVFDITKRLAYEKEPINNSLLILDPVFEKMALEAFVIILKYIGDYSTTKSTFQLALEFLELGLQNPVIRDELYVQLCKQATLNDDKEKCISVWHLITFCTGLFPPNPKFLPYINTFIKENTQDETGVGRYAADSLKRLARTVKKNIQRKSVPSIQELKNTIYHHPLVLTVYLPDGNSTRLVTINSSTTVDEAIHLFGEQMELLSDAGYGLWQIIDLASGWIVPLKGDIYLADFFRKLELENRDITKSFMFKKRVNFYSDDKKIDSSEVDLIFAEAVNIVIRGQFPATEELATKLAALHLQTIHGDHNPEENIFNIKTFDQYLPKEMIEILDLNKLQVKTWIDSTKACWASLSGTNSAEAKTIYIRNLRNWHLFGSSIWSAEQKNRPKRILIAINKDGIFILNQQSLQKDLLHRWNWSEIILSRAEEGVWHLNVGSLLKPQKYHFFAKYAETIHLIFEEYKDTFYLHHQKSPPKPQQELPVTVSTSMERMQEQRFLRSITTSVSQSSSSGKEEQLNPRRTIVQKDFNFELTPSRSKTSMNIGSSRQNKPGEWVSGYSSNSNSVFAMFDFRERGETRFTKSRLDWEIEWKDLTIEKELGRGAFGIVYKGKWKKMDVAIKKVIEVLSPEQMQHFLQEADLMSKIRPHDNIVQLIGVCRDPPVIVTRYYANGSLNAYLKRCKTNIPQHVIIKILKGISAGMEHLHSEGIIHRDLASRNILLDTHFSAIVADFGFARVLSGNETDKTSSNVGPIKWMALECLEKREYSIKTDVWAFGVTIWEVITGGETPYADLDNLGTVVAVLNGRRLEIPKTCHPRLAKLILSTWENDPEKRPSFQKIHEELEIFEQELGFKRSLNQKQDSQIKGPVELP